MRFRIRVQGIHPSDVVRDIGTEPKCPETVSHKSSLKAYCIAGAAISTGIICIIHKIGKKRRG